MKIVITQYPFFREEFVPTPSDEEKAAYVGLVLQSSGYMPECDVHAHIAFPGGAYQISLYTLLYELLKLSEELKQSIIPRWMPYLDMAEKQRKVGNVDSYCCRLLRSYNNSELSKRLSVYAQPLFYADKPKGYQARRCRLCHRFTK